jgi:hypothetical protein
VKPSHVHKCIFRVECERAGYSLWLTWLLYTSIESVESVLSDEATCSGKEGGRHD